MFQLPEVLSSATCAATGQRITRAIVWRAIVVPLLGVQICTLMNLLTITVRKLTAVGCHFFLGVSCAQCCTLHGHAVAVSSLA